MLVLFCEIERRVPSLEPIHRTLGTGHGRGPSMEHQPNVRHTLHTRFLGKPNQPRCTRKQWLPGQKEDNQDQILDSKNSWEANYLIFTSYRYLKAIDKFNERFISAYLTAGNIKLLLLHDAKSDDAIRNFFNDCYELYIKVSVALALYV
jgi:hypothetical protein